jgi:WD40 repeat protein/tetratricopeptide (TPR) repeat protein
MHLRGMGIVEEFNRTNRGLTTGPRSISGSSSIGESDIEDTNFLNLIPYPSKEDVTTIVDPKRITTLQMTRQTVVNIVRNNERPITNALFIAQEKDRQLQKAVERQSRALEGLEGMNLDLQESMSKGTRNKQSLNNLEAHILHMRKLLRQQDATGEEHESGVPRVIPDIKNKKGKEAHKAPPTAKTSRVKDQNELVMEELTIFPESEDTEECPKCNKNFILGFLKRHLEGCDGTRSADIEDDEEGEDFVIGKSGQSDHKTLEDENEDDNDDDVESKFNKVMADGGVIPIEEFKNQVHLKNSNLQQCSICLRSYPKGKIDEHVYRCTKKNIRMNKKAEQDAAGGTSVSEGATVPGPVHHLKAMTPTCSAIPLQWEPPLFNGGAPIFDYQIEYTKRIKIQESINRFYFIEEVVKAPVSSTLWVLKAPVNHRGFNLPNLEGDTVYSHIRVRAVNEKGAGPWSEPLNAIKTQPALPSSPPVQFIVSEPPGPTSIKLSWEAPLEVNGGKITGYEVRYKLHKRDFNSSIGNNKQAGFKLVDTALKASATDRSMTISNLPGECTVSDVRCFTIDAQGRYSPPSKSIETIRTSKMGREEFIQYELNEKKKMRDLEVDVILHDSHQIINRLVYIGLLELELKGIEQRRAKLAAKRKEERALASARLNGDKPITLEEEERKRFAEDAIAAEEEAAAEKAAVKALTKASRKIGSIEKEEDSKSKRYSNSSTNDSSSDLALLDAQRRREQFEFRITALQEKIDEQSDASMRFNTRKQQLKHVLVQSDRRLRLLTAENEMLKNFTGKEVDTLIMHGRMQRFDTQNLRKLINEEVEEVEENLVVGKREMLKTIEHIERCNQKKKAFEDSLNDRRAAFLAFEKDEVRRMRLLQLQSHFVGSSVYNCFQTWKQRISNKKKAAERFHFALLRWANLGMARAFKKWWKLVEAVRQTERLKALEDKDELITGRGSALLEAALKQRMDAVDDVTALTAWMRSVEKELDGGNVERAYRQGLRDVGTIPLHGNKAVMRPRSRLAAKERAQKEKREIEASQQAALADALDANKKLREMYTEAEPVEEPDPSLKSADLYNGPAMEGTLPLWAVGDQVIRRVPILKLVDGAVTKLDPTMLRDKSGAGALELMNQHSKGIMDGEALVEATKKSMNAAEALQKLGPDAILLPTDEKKRANLSINNDDVANAVDDHVKAQLARAEAFLNTRRFDAALICAKQCEAVYGFRKDAKGLLAVYRLLSKLLEAVGRFDLGVLHWDRAFALAGMTEVDNALAQAEALEGRGRCLHERSDFADALLSFEKAEDLYEERNDLPSRARVFRLQAKTLTLLRQHKHADDLIVKAEEIERRLSSLLSSAIARLKNLETELVGMGVGDSEVIQLEICGPAVPAVRQQLRFLSFQCTNMRDSISALKKMERYWDTRIKTLKEELNRADKCEGLVFTSRVISGGLHEYEILEAKNLIQKGEVEAVRNFHKFEEEVRSKETELRNLESERVELIQYAEAESHGLAKLAYGRRNLRCVALNVSNRRTNNIQGLASGGYPSLAAAIDAQVFVYSTVDGEAQNAFLGDSGRDPMGEMVGHSKPISCIAFHSDRIYTGSVDGSIRGWNAYDNRGWGSYTPIDHDIDEQEKTWMQKQIDNEKIDKETGLPEKPRRPFVRDAAAIRKRKAGALCAMKGHEGAVVSLAVNHRIVISGGADTMIFAWHPETGRLLRRMRGHEFAVTSLAIDDSLFCSGSADRIVRLWGITDISPTNPAKTVEQIRRYSGHQAPITAVELVGKEVVSGASNGEVIIWNFETSEPLRRHQIHEVGRSVLAIQFDAVKLVTAGSDHKLVFSDFLSGEPFQTSYRSHGDSHILAMCFDTENLITAGADRTVRVWQLNKGASGPGGIAKQKRLPKMHIIKPNEHLRTIASQYGCSMKEIMKWNNVTDLRQLYPGLRIKVEPEAGSEEFIALQRRKKLQYSTDSEGENKSDEKSQNTSEKTLVIEDASRTQDGEAAAQKSDDTLISLLLEEARIKENEAATVNKTSSRPSTAKTDSSNNLTGKANPISTYKDFVKVNTAQTAANEGHMLSADDQLKAVQDALDKAAVAKAARTTAQAATTALKDVSKNLPSLTPLITSPNPKSKSRFGGVGDLRIAGDVNAIPHPLERIQLTTQQVRLIAESGDVRSTTVAESASYLPTGDLKKKQANLGDAGKLSLKGSALSANVYAEHMKVRDSASTPKKGNEGEDDERYMPAATSPVATLKGTTVANSLKKGKSLRQLAQSAKGIQSHVEHSLSNIFDKEKVELH